MRDFPMCAAMSCDLVVVVVVVVVIYVGIEMMTNK